MAPESANSWTAHELNEEVIPIIKLDHKSLLADPLAMALNSAHGVAFHRGLGTPLYPTSPTPMIKYLDADRIASFSQAAYAKDNIAVVANGANHSEFSKWVGEFFIETGSGSPDIKLSSPPTKYFGGEERIAHDGANVMVIAFPGSSSFTSGSSYKPEIGVLAALLGGESSIKWSPGFSLLAKAASEYQHAHVSTRNDAYSDAGLLYVTITGNPFHIAKASKNVVDTLKKIAAGDVSTEDIKKATALAKFRALESGQTTDAGLEATGSGLITGGKPHQIDEVGQSIDKVGQDKVKAVSALQQSHPSGPQTNSQQAAKSLLETRATVSTVGDLFVLPFAEEIGLTV
jgi:ubiquinol-cytochrome c reductase core subunit 2